MVSHLKGVLFLLYFEIFANDFGKIAFLVLKRAFFNDDMVTLNNP
jgi:hypothetical protein